MLLIAEYGRLSSKSVLHRDDDFDAATTERLMR